jgi:hypothetical protein
MLCYNGAARPFGVHRSAFGVRGSLFSEAKSALPLLYSIEVPSFDDVLTGLELQEIAVEARSAD